MSRKIAEVERLESRIYPSLRFNNPTEERLQFAKQLDVSHIIVHPYAQSYLPDEELPLSTDTKWSFEELLHLRNFIEEHGFTLGAIENFPLSFYEDIMLGRDGREEQLKNVKTSIRNMGRAGIPTLGYNWMPNRVWRSSLTHPGRGGATSTVFDMADMERAPLTHDREYDEEEMWGNYQYFLEEVLPVAEEEGVTLCLHPDDPPVSSLGGIARLFQNFENLQKAMELIPSDNHKIQLGLGVFSEMDIDIEVREMVEFFAQRDEISYVHFRDVENNVPAFQEVFLDEGNYDEFEVLRTLIEGGFEGMVIPDHVPKMEGEADWGPSGRAFTIGYIRGMLKALENADY
jgi:mannonate dehydratase